MNQELCTLGKHIEMLPFTSEPTLRKLMSTIELQLVIKNVSLLHALLLGEFKQNVIVSSSKMYNIRDTDIDALFKSRFPKIYYDGINGKVNEKISHSMPLIQRASIMMDITADKIIDIIFICREHPVMGADILNSIQEVVPRNIISLIQGFESPNTNDIINYLNNSNRQTTDMTIGDYIFSDSEENIICRESLAETFHDNIVDRRTPEPFSNWNLNKRYPLLKYLDANTEILSLGLVLGDTIKVYV